MTHLSGECIIIDVFIASIEFNNLLLSSFDATLYTRLFLPLPARLSTHRGLYIS
jgi:hypothetical protein